MWEQQSHSHGSVPGTAKVRRTAGNPVSLQQTPDVHISPTLSPSLFLLSVSTSPVKGKKKKNWQRCVPVVKLVVFLPIAFLHFPTLHPRCGQSGVEMTKLCRNNPDEPSELKIEILVFLKGFKCNGLLFIITERNLVFSKIIVWNNTGLSCFYGEDDVGTQGWIRHQRWLMRDKKSRQAANRLAGEKRKSVSTKVADLPIKWVEENQLIYQLLSSWFSQF